jgi:hypothetical protein
MEASSLYRYCYISAVLLFIGITTSGLLSNLFIYTTHPQPAWKDIETYAAHFHPVQMLPFWAGFLMLIGFIGLVAGIHYQAPAKYRFFTLLAVVAAAIYGTLISLNYMLQLGVLQANIESSELNGMALLAFANPHSVTMSIEMLGYGFQGAATWLTAYALDDSPIGKWAGRLGILNGIVSIAGVIIQGFTIPMSTAHSLGWIAFIGWNVLFMVLCFLYVLYFRRKLMLGNSKTRKFVIKPTY